MTDDQILGTALSLWMGFALALQVRTQITQDKAHSGTALQFPLILARLIYFSAGLAGVLGFSWLIGHVSQFKNGVFPIGFISGVALFCVTIYLKGKANGNSTNGSAAGEDPFMTEPSKRTVQKD